MRAVDPRGDTHIGNRADAAHHVERHEADHHRETLEALVAIGELVVEEEVPGHGGEGGDRLRPVEGHREGERLVQREEMHGKTRRADEGEQDEADGNAIAGELGKQQAQVFEHHHVVELALAVLAGAEHERQLDDFERAAARCQNVEQDLEAARRELGRERLEGGPVDHEEAAHGVGQRDAEQALREQGRGRAAALAHAGEALLGAAALDEARADGEIGPGFDLLQHRRQQFFVVLQIAVHDGDGAGGGGQHALDAGAGEAPATDAPDAAHTRVGAGNLAHRLGGPVRAIVVDENHLPLDRLERLAQARHENGNVTNFVERGNDHRQRRRGGRGRARGSGRELGKHLLIVTLRCGARAAYRLPGGSGNRLMCQNHRQFKNSGERGKARCILRGGLWQERPTSRRRHARPC